MIPKSFTLLKNEILGFFLVFQGVKFRTNLYVQLRLDWLGTVRNVRTKFLSLNEDIFRF